MLNARRVEEDESIIGDITGITRGKAMPSKKFNRNERVFTLPSIFFQTIDGNYVNMDIENQWTEADMQLIPDFNTVTAAGGRCDHSAQFVEKLSTCLRTKAGPMLLPPNWNFT